MSSVAPPPHELAARLRDVQVGIRQELEVTRQVFRDAAAYVVFDPVTFQAHRLACRIGRGEGSELPHRVRAGGGLHAYCRRAEVAEVVAGVDAHARPAELYQFHAFKRLLGHGCHPPRLDNPLLFQGGQLGGG